MRPHSPPDNLPTRDIPGSETLPVLTEEQVSSIIQLAEALDGVYRRLRAEGYRLESGRLVPPSDKLLP